jgi:hypothetical protein
MVYERAYFVGDKVRIERVLKGNRSEYTHVVVNDITFQPPQSRVNLEIDYGSKKESLTLHEGDSYELSKSTRANCIVSVPWSAVNRGNCRVNGSNNSNGLRVKLRINASGKFRLNHFD